MSRRKRHSEPAARYDALVERDAQKKARVAKVVADVERFVIEAMPKIASDFSAPQLPAEPDTFDEDALDADHVWRTEIRTKERSVRQVQRAYGLPENALKAVTISVLVDQTEQSLRDVDVNVYARLVASLEFGEGSLRVHARNRGTFTSTRGSR